MSITTNQPKSSEFFSALFYDDQLNPIQIYRLMEAEVFDEAIEMASEMMEEDASLEEFDILISNDMPVSHSL